MADPAAGHSAATPVQLAPDPIALWTAALLAANRSPVTIKSWTRLIRRAAADTGRDPLALSATDITLWLAGFAHPKTRATYHSALSAWHRWLLRAGLRSDDPMAMLDAPRLPRAVPRPSTTDSLEVLLTSQLTWRARAMILVAAYQALRCKEVAAIHGQDIDHVAGTIRVTGKGGHVRVLPLHPVIADLALVMPSTGWWFASPIRRGRPVQGRAVSSTIGRAMRKAQIRGTAHSLRHWTATTMLEEGADIRQVQEVLGHASLQTTQIYTFVNPTRLRSAVERLPTLRPVAGAR